MMTATFVLALTLSPNLKLLKERAWAPPPPPAVTPTRAPIEVTVGALPAGVGGAPDEAVLKAARLPLEGKALLDFFRKRTPPAPSREKIEELVKRLADADGDRAQEELTAIGPAVLPAIRSAINNGEDPEATKRARAVMATLEADAASALVSHAARGLAATKPAGAAEALLGYLPYAEDNVSFQEIHAALLAVALRDGKPDPVLLKALEDKLAIRRGVAAAVVSAAGGPAHYPALRPLLKDPKPSVRLGVALGLVGAHDGEAVPVLIDLLAELPPGLRTTAEEHLANLAGEWAVAGPKGPDVMSGKLRRAVWDAWWKNTDGSLLLEEFRSRTPTEDDREKIEALITTLAGDDAAKRDAAADELTGFGKRASALLRRAITGGNPKAVPFAQKALEAIEKDEPNPLPQAAARLLALRKPEGTVETLLAYLAVSESEDVSAQLIDILAGVACAGGKADDAILAALKDRSPARRAAAALAICKANATAALPSVKKLLTDKDPVVKLRVASGLATVGDKAGIPALIAALIDLPQEQVWEAEDLLGRLAGDKAPTETAGETKESREKAMNAWEKWFKENGAGLDLAKADLANHAGGGGQLIVVEQWNRAKGGRGRVLEMDAAGKVRWEIDNLDYPWDAQVLRNGNVLVIEQQNRVTERDRKNKILWDKYFSSPFVVERLPNGHTFLGCRNNLMVVDKDGKTVFNHIYNTNTILGAKRFRDGSMAFVSYSGEYVRLDRTGKELKRATFPISSYSLVGADILPGDRVVISTNSHHKVIEYTPDGKEAWSTTVNNPNPPTRLTNGNTLVGSTNAMALVEIDRKGKIVKEWKGLSHNPFRAFRR